MGIFNTDLITRGVGPYFKCCLSGLGSLGAAGTFKVAIDSCDLTDIF